MKIRQVQNILVRHRFLGKFGWHFSSTGGSGSAEFHSAASAPKWVIKLRAQQAVRYAKHLLDGESNWGQLTRNIQELIAYPSTIGDKQRYLGELGAALRKHPLKNRALGRRLAEIVAVNEQITQLAGSREQGRAAELAKQALAQAASLLENRRMLVLMVPGVRQPGRTRKETGPELYSPSEIDRAYRTWARFEGFTAGTCSECYATVNVLAGGPGWFCECGHYNCQGWHDHFIPYQTPDYGPTQNDVRIGVHASCGEDCSYCHGRIRLETAAA